MISRYLLLSMFVVFSCESKDTSLSRFIIGSEELINLITNKNQSREDFIREWNLTPCPKESEESPLYYCVQENAVEFEITNRGYIIGINNLDFENYESLKTDLSRTHVVVDKQELIRENAKYNSSYLTDINMYIGSGYDLIVATSKRDGKTSYTIVGNSED